MMLSWLPSIDEIKGATRGCSIMRPPASSNAVAGCLTEGRRRGKSLTSALVRRFDSHDKVISAQEGVLHLRSRRLCLPV